MTEPPSDDAPERWHNELVLAERLLEQQTRRRLAEDLLLGVVVVEDERLTGGEKR